MGTTPCIYLCRSLSSLLFLALLSTTVLQSLADKQQQPPGSEQSPKRVGRQLSFHLPSNPFSDTSHPFSNIFQDVPTRLFGDDSPFRQAFPGFESTTFHLPFDNLFSTLLQDAQAPMDINLSPDGAHVLVKVNLHRMDHAGKRRVNAKVVSGGRHLRVTIISDSMRAEHTVSLPRKVTGEGMGMEGDEGDQSVMLKLKVVKDEDGGAEVDGVARYDIGGFGLFVDVLDGLLGFGKGGNKEEIAGGDEIGGLDGGSVEDCTHRFGGDPLKVKRCECEIAEKDDEKAVCYASLVSSGMKMTKRLGLMGVASEMKHEALACADGADDRKTKCLEGIVDKLMKAIGEQRGLRKRIRAEIEGDDQMGKEKERGKREQVEGGMGLPGVLMWILVMALVGIVGWIMLKERRSLGRYSHSNGLTSHLSSALSVMSGLKDGRSAFSRKNGNVKMMKD